MSDTRTILLTQLLTVIVTPISIALTLLLIENGRAPKPDLRYVKASPEYIVIEPDSSLVSKINNDGDLAAGFRGELRQATAGHENAETCTAWLDGGSWDSDCLQLYKSVANQVRGMLQSAIAQGHGSVQESAARNSLKTIEELRTELTKVENSPQPRAGSVAIAVGVLNVGGSDGTVFNEASVKFDNKVMRVYADGYSPVTAHGFSEVTFRTARENSGQFVGTVMQGDESAVTAWSDLVKKGNDVPFEVTVTFSGKVGTIKGTVFKDE